MEPLDKPDFEKEAIEYFGECHGDRAFKAGASYGYDVGWKARDKEAQWISVEERLPECYEQHGRVYSSGVVLTYFNGEYEINELIQDGSNARWLSEGVSHWRHLNPPKSL